MKRISVILCAFLVWYNSFSQEIIPWVESLPIAKIQARSENKMILMVWEGATEYPMPVLIKDERGKDILIDNLFETPQLNELLWQYFVPVVVGDESYADWFLDIKDKRSQAYIDKFNDDSLKVIDVNGNILGTSGAYTELLDLTKFITKYGFETSYIKQELLNYHQEKNFYSAFYLASKYVDFSLLVNEKVRSEILDLSDIYFSEAKDFISSENRSDDKAQLQRIDLLKLKQELIKNRPRKVLRRLKKIDDLEIEKVNEPLATFLYYTAFRLLNDTEKFQRLESSISLLNLKQAQLIVNINR
ncbi:hypothetical protein DFQ05_2112 [Winogradskyella wandonensis]|uniref:Uncharacterized protein n=1 Tax=Winogradskyella wandonensis TaxID=1442586 RepID=A0A4R1KPA5_9FLAO|nr:hypothetical protein [Winogradskyella wandonensis]TCK66828.1 hypothetical protein DFQ05_2112 [Winogradskyella wandonensis]